MNATVTNELTESKFTLEHFRPYNLLEQHRLETFKDWPFSAASSCSIAKMAEAGFYWTGTEKEKDTATCFVCCKTLDGWESNDNPWEEHRKHAPQCEFVKLGRPEKDIIVSQFLDLIGTVLKARISRKTKEFKQKLAKECAAKVEEFKRQHSRK